MADQADAASLFSPHWYRVANLRPRLRGHIEVKRQSRRGQVWRLLDNAANHRIHRINEAAYAFVGRCDGQHSTEQIWQALLAADAEAVPSQDEIVGLLVQLHQAGLLQFDVTPDFAAVVASRQRARRQKWRARVNPLAFRVPLFNPGLLLRRLEFWLAPLLGRWGLMVTALLILAAVPVAAGHAGEIQAYADRWLYTPRYLMALWLIYPLMKAAHELAHGLAIRRGGGEVPEMGITLLMLTPVPYVDARAASAFRLARQRAAVAAAGVFAELAIAALGLFAWLALQPGLPRDLAFVAFVVGVFSSLLVNGNPLLQFDGYFVLCDALGLANLGPRSAAWWAQRLRRLAGADAHRLEPARGELPWLVAYLPLSLAYRIWLAIAVVAWLGSKYYLFGVLAALVTVNGLLLKPAQHFTEHLVDRAGADGSWRRWLPLAILLAILAVPVPFSTVAQGVVWLPEQATARAGSEGFIAELPVADGQPVAAGQRLVGLRNEDLLAERERLAGELAGQQSQYLAQVGSTPERARELAEAMERTRSELALAEQRIAGLDVVAGRAGRFAMPRQADQIGRLASRGEILGYLLDPTQPVTVRVALPHEQAVLATTHTRRIDVRLADQPFATWPAVAGGIVAAAADRLPSAALGVHSGGAIVTDPADDKHLKSREPVVWLDLTLRGASSPRIGTRATVRFDHGWAPLAEQLLRRAQQMWLRHVNPAQ
jgi:putative peptide zinc metalloprotease protein